MANENGNQYSAASIEATVKVEAFRPGEKDAEGAFAVYAARRTVEMTFHEQFKNDAELDSALETFTASVKAAARREGT